MFYVSRLDVISPDDERSRVEVDSILGVTTWSAPAKRDARVESSQVEAIPAGAPAWWHGDEEASQMFLREMGVS